MEHIKQFINEINLSNSNIYKQDVLKKYKDDEKIRWFLKYYFDPFSTTNISIKKLNKDVSCRPTKAIRTFEECIEFAVNNCTGKYTDVAAINSFVYVHKEDKEFIHGCLAKTIKIGVSEKTINKVFGKDFIPTMELQLAEKYFDNMDYVEGKEFALTLKLDGIRCVASKKNGKVSLVARSGQPIIGAVDIENDLRNVKEDNFVLDGELLVDDWRNMKSKEAYKATTKIVRRDAEKHGIRLVVFDMVSIKEWNERASEGTYKDRRKRFRKIVEQCEHVEKVPLLYLGKDTSKINELLKKVTRGKRSQEGLMINIADAPYQFRRTKDLLKVKRMNDCDLRVVGVQEGRGKYKGLLGSLIVEYKGNTVKVGSGLTESLRKAFWKDKDNLIGRVVKVQFFEETQDANGNKSLRFPVFLELCPENKEPSLF